MQTQRADARTARATCVRVKERCGAGGLRGGQRGCTWSYARERRLVDVTQFM